MHKVLQTRYPHYSHKQNHRPIECLRRRLVTIWPEAPEESPSNVDHCCYVDVDTRFAQGPSSGKEGIAAEAFQKDAADRDTVSGHQGNDTEREDSVEGDG